MSRHHWMYFGCQCSSARCNRLLLESPTLLGIRSAEIICASCQGRMANGECLMPNAELALVIRHSPFFTLRPVEIELRARLRPVGGQRPLLPHGVRPDE